MNTLSSIVDAAPVPGGSMEESLLLLIINPGSTSTKIAVYDELEECFSAEISHKWDELEMFETVADQEAYRYDLVIKALEAHTISLAKISGVVGRGGLLHPIESGAYQVNEKMVRDLKNAVYGEHASNLGAVLAKRIGDELNIPAFIADPVVVDELCAQARFSGMPDIERKSIFHALNHKSVAKLVAQELNLAYDEANFIVAHLGGGISVGAHSYGRVVDVNNALDGDGPFSPERAGGIPAGQLARLVHSEKYTIQEMQKKLCGKGGVFAYLGTKDMLEVRSRIESGDEYAKLIVDALAYQISKEISGLAAYFCGDVDAIILTGGLARLKLLTDEITRMISFIGPVRLVPGEREMEALAENGLEVLLGHKQAKQYE